MAAHVQIISYKKAHMQICMCAHAHTQQGETGSPVTLHDWSLFPPLSLPAEIVLTKGRGRGGVVGGGDVCTALLSLGEGECERGREKGAGGLARGCRREG